MRKNLSLGKSFGITQKLKKPISFKKIPCIRTFNAISILSNGNVRLCGCRLNKTANDDLVVGNISKNSLKEILNNNKVSSIRTSFKKGKLPSVCNDCSFYESCK